MSIFNYLEFGFDVDLNCLEVFKKDKGIIKFSTGNFPFGGLERFFITLKAFQLIPIECFDGFSVNQIDWKSDFDYEKQLSQMNQIIGDGVETVFFISQPEYSHISSTLVREVIKGGGDATVFLPEGFMVG